MTVAPESIQIAAGGQTLERWRAGEDSIVIQPRGAKLDAESRYGYCSRANCGAPIVSRTRGIPCHDKCARGHMDLAIKTLGSRPVEKTAYVCGFMFDPMGGVVVLVLKDRPVWQAGMLNGVGGKIEPGETTAGAMVREFAEETGVMTRLSDWSEFATLNGKDATVHFMRAFSDSWHQVRTMESEMVRWYPLGAIRAGAYPTLGNLSFLIPLALTGGFEPVQLSPIALDEAKLH